MGRKQYYSTRKVASVNEVSCK